MHAHPAMLANTYLSAPFACRHLTLSHSTQQGPVLPARVCFVQQQQQQQQIRSCRKHGLGAMLAGGRPLPIVGAPTSSGGRVTGLYGTSNGSGAPPPPAFLRPKYPPSPPPMPGAGISRSNVRVRLSGDVVQPLVVSGPWQAGPGETCDSVFPNMEVRRVLSSLLADNSTSQ
jgi:hypothetical protein